MEETRVRLTLMIVLALLVLAGCSAQASDTPAAPTPTPQEKSEPTPTPAPSPTTIALPDQGAAPDFQNDVWINSEPLRLADLRGKVVFIEFWTYGCVNCQRVIPYINEWYEAYGGDDFEVVGVHYPEFNYERDVANVRKAVDRFHIEHPVAIDNERQTWAAYNQRYWPTRYILDKRGRIRYKHIGEGAYAETEAVIRQLMAEPDP